MFSSSHQLDVSISIGEVNDVDERLFRGKHYWLGTWGKLLPKFPNACDIRLDGVSY